MGEPPMAGAHSASISFALKSLPKPLIPLCTIHSGFPSKPTKRKNHLRPKILKTLNKPFPSTPADPIIPVEAPDQKPQEAAALEPLFDGEEDEEKAKGTDVEELRVSDTTVVAGEERSIHGKLSAKTVLRYGFYVVGVFLFQTICAVLFLGNANPEEKVGNSDSLDKNGNLRERNIGRGKYFLDKKGKVFKNREVFTNSSHLVYWNEPELEKRIEEIRALARDARRAEEKELQNDKEDGGLSDKSSNSRGRMEIEKEIRARLNNVEKSLNSKLRDQEEAKEVNQALLFKKKFKFKGPGKNTRKDVKGFPGSKQKKVDKIQSELGAANGNAGLGAIADANQIRSRVEGSESTKQRESKAQNSVLTQEKKEGSSSFNIHGLSSKNGQSEHREVVNISSGNRMNTKQSGNGTDMWWLDLPFVLVILMHRDLDCEGSQGLFTLRTTSQTQEQSNTSYTLAFEDRGEANNFCYLLESFFEDLGDFHAEVVPLSVKELREAVEAHTKKVVVVRKGQLKLYAGQPFEEVETALHSLVEQNQRLSTA